MRTIPTTRRLHDRISLPHSHWSVWLLVWRIRLQLQLQSPENESQLTQERPSHLNKGDNYPTYVLPSAFQPASQPSIHPDVHTPESNSLPCTVSPSLTSGRQAGYNSQRSITTTSALQAPSRTFLAAANGVMTYGQITRHRQTQTYIRLPQVHHQLFSEIKWRSSPNNRTPRGRRGIHTWARRMSSRGGKFTIDIPRPRAGCISVNGTR
ncbi:hypothetical protein FA13DRAFT_226018 [Coprinellus micaceus]|uniref:Uncharacterized protein n=1 Tax=Coprinellus micaceus TaxID=71717 RepID=A0A4Y7TGR5_COPMI|nr:hypothetical protein FA13DRAFT_226018 [Coprinellus micaceus]